MLLPPSRLTITTVENQIYDYVTRKGDPLACSVGYTTLDEKDVPRIAMTMANLDDIARTHRASPDQIRQIHKTQRASPH